MAGTGKNEGKISDAAEKIPTFEEAVNMCINNPEFMANYQRLRETKTLVSKPAENAIERMIDQATGYGSTVDKKEAFELFEFIRDYVWWPVAGPMIAAKVKTDAEVKKK